MWACEVFGASWHVHATVLAATALLARFMTTHFNVTALQEKARQAVDWGAAAAAARAEIGFLRHMGGCHAAAAQLLEAERQQRHMAERGRRAAFVAAAREALGASWLDRSLNLALHIMCRAAHMCTLYYRVCALFS